MMSKRAATRCLTQDVWLVLGRWYTQTWAWQKGITPPIALWNWNRRPQYQPTPSPVNSGQHSWLGNNNRFRLRWFFCRFWEKVEESQTTSITIFYLDMLLARMSDEDISRRNRLFGIALKRWWYPSGTTNSAASWNFRSSPSLPATKKWQSWWLICCKAANICSRLWP